MLITYLSLTTNRKNYILQRIKIVIIFQDYRNLIIKRNISISITILVAEVNFYLCCFFLCQRTRQNDEKSLI